MNSLIKIFFLGFGILIVAILINLTANFLGLETWYSFIESIQGNGLFYSFKQNWLNLIFLFIIYPLILGFSAKHILKILN